MTLMIYTVCVFSSSEIGISIIYCSVLLSFCLYNHHCSRLISTLKVWDYSSTFLSMSFPFAARCWVIALTALHSTVICSFLKKTVKHFRPKQSRIQELDSERLNSLFALLFSNQSIKSSGSHKGKAKWTYSCIYFDNFSVNTKALTLSY